MSNYANSYRIVFKFALHLIELPDFCNCLIYKELLYPTNNRATGYTIFIFQTNYYQKLLYENIEIQRKNTRSD